MTELQFLIDLLLNHKLTSETKKLVADRIGFVETRLSSVSSVSPQMSAQNYTRPSPTAQAPSTQKILDEIGIQAPVMTQVGQTAAAQAALAARADAIRIATSGVEEKGRSAPRKF